MIGPYRPVGNIPARRIWIERGSKAHCSVAWDSALVLASLPFAHIQVKLSGISQIPHDLQSQRAFHEGLQVVQR